MDITRKNFRERLEECKHAVSTANFIAIDCEFTGITQENVKVFPYDSPSEYYHKICQQTSGYIAIQFGFTAFRFEKNSQKFTYRSYNFYVYPQLKKQRFECQGDSIAFLGSVNFDFNKLFREGISYCDELEAKDLRQKFESKLKLESEQNESSNSLPEITIPDGEVDFMEKTKNEIEEFLQSNETEKCIGKFCNAFQRKLIYQLLRMSYADTIYANSKNDDNNRKVIVIQKKLSEDEIRQKRNEQTEKDRQEMENTIGFSNFITFLSQSKKLIVGHNMLLDIIYIMKQFIAPVSHRLQEFKTKTHKVFPNLLDTKYMCTDDSLKSEIKSSTLSELLQTLSQEPFKKPIFEADGDEYGYALNEPKEHEAGYDSFVTGVCFITMANYLKIDSGDINEKSPKLRHILNRIFTMRIDVNNINLTGNDPPSPSRDHVFHINVPRTWNNSNIFSLFRLFGNVFVSWVDDTSAFVALHNRENASGLLKRIGKAEGVTLISYADFKKQKNRTIKEDKSDKEKKTENEESSAIETKKRKLNVADNDWQTVPKKRNKLQGTSKVFEAVDEW